MSSLQPMIINTILKSLAIKSIHIQSRYSATYSTSKKYEIIYRGDIPKLKEIKPPADEKIHDNDMTYSTKGYDRTFLDMKVDDFASLYESDKTGKTKQFIQTVLNEYESIKYNTLGRVPTRLTLQDMAKMINDGGTISSREQILNYLFKREMAARAEEHKRLRRRELAALRRLQDDASDQPRTGLLSREGDLLYGLWHNSLFCRIPEATMKGGMGSSRIREAAMFGRKIIFDMSYGEHMHEWLYQNVLEQMAASFGLNLYHYREPFDIWLCNMTKGGYEERFLEKSKIKQLCQKAMVTIKEDCFTNHFDKSKLVYLSPSAKETLNFDIGRTNDIYIIGAYNDKGAALPLSLRKANKLGIRARKFPLDDYIAWGPSATKNLCINHVTGILLEVMSNGGDWKAAFEKHIPSRKIKKIETIVEEERRRKQKRFSFDIRSDLEW